MTAQLTTLDPIMKRWYVGYLVDRFTQNVLKPTPEWSAWAAQWREEVPLTRKQQRENASWRRRVKDATKALREAEAKLRDEIVSIEHDYGVRVFAGGCGCDDGDGESTIESDQPHKVTYRTKDGAPPEPPMWPTIRFETAKFTHAEPLTTRSRSQEGLNR